MLDAGAAAGMKVRSDEAERFLEERSETRARDAGSPPSPGALLLDRLSLLVGSDQAASALIAHALRSARRDELPVGHELGEFVRAHLLEPLTHRVGPRLTSALLADLDDELLAAPPALASHGAALGAQRPSPTEGSALTCVVVIERDVLARANLARTAIRGGFEVRVAHDLDELRRIDPPVDVVIVDVTAVDPSALGDALAVHRPLPAVMVWTADKRLTSVRALRDARVEHAEVVPKTASTAELLAVLRQLVGRRSSASS